MTSVFIFLFTFLFSGGLNQLSSSEKIVENFTLSDYNGKKHTLQDYQNSKAIVVMFIATRCPISNAYNERMNKIFADYESKGVTFLGINSNVLENAEEVKKHAEENKFKFVVLKDPDNVIADKFKATVTPEIYVLNPKFEILYHGRIDDSRREEEVKSQDLRKALDEVLTDKKVSVTVTRAFGCTIKRAQ